MLTEAELELLWDILQQYNEDLDDKINYEVFCSVKKELHTRLIAAANKGSSSSSNGSKKNKSNNSKDDNNKSTTTIKNIEYYFRPSVFLKFQRDNQGRIGIEPFYNYVTKKGIYPSLPSIRPSLQLSSISFDNLSIYLLRYTFIIYIYSFMNLPIQFICWNNTWFYANTIQMDKDIW